MNTQTLLTVAAVIGPLAGVALGAFLASRFQQGHWFRDRRLDAFVAAQTAAFRVFAGASANLAKLSPTERLQAMTRLAEASMQWGEARACLNI